MTTSLPMATRRACAVPAAALFTLLSTALLGGCAGPAGSDGGGDDVAEVDAAAQVDVGADALGDAGPPAECALPSDCPQPSAPCRRATCNEGVCGEADAQGAPCEDGEVCTLGDRCLDGACTAGVDICECRKSADCAERNDPCLGQWMCDTGAAPYRCAPIPGSDVTCKGDTGEACTKEVCDPAKGACATVATDAAWLDCTPAGCTWRAAPAGMPKGPVLACDDGQPCTKGDTCEGATCKPGPDTCDCAKDADCPDDGDACNGTNYCDKGTCKLNPTSVVSCSSSKDTACTANTCDPKTGACAMAPIKEGQLCDDGDPCTQSETCKGGTCTSAVNTCVCSSDKDCASKEDGDACNGTLYCDKASGKCVLNPATVVSCPTVGDTGCLKNVCYPKSGLCQPTAVEKTKQACVGKTCTWALKGPGDPAGKPVPCDDGDSCTSGEACTGGACKGGTDTCACSQDSDCAKLDDGNACNGTLYCDKAQQKCVVNPASFIPCPTFNDTDCSKNACVPGKFAEDGKSQLCEMTPVGQTAPSCYDPKDPSTCIRAVKAGPETKALPCEDGDACTSGDICAAGQCIKGKTTCTCSKDIDCVKEDDGNLCNGTLYCDLQTGLCKDDPTSVVVCKTVDDTTCSKNACAPKSGACEKTPVEKTKKLCAKDAGCRYEVDLSGAATVTACEDGQPCTKGDTCEDGSCSAGTNTCECLKDADCDIKDDGNACTGTWYCDKSDLAKPVCKLNAATVVFCTPSADPCVQNTCNPVNGDCKKVAANAGKACDDGSVCTSKDACKNGACVGDAISCDDGDACTTDLCDKQLGCTHKASNCSDGNTCTVDTCDPKTGQCSFPKAKDGALCNADGNGCTVNDTCTNGSCVAGGAVKCTLKVGACEQALCVSKGATQYTCQVAAKQENAPCDDNEPCTAVSRCVNGTCSGKGKERFYVKTLEPPLQHGQLLASAVAPDGDIFTVGGTFGGKDVTGAWWIAHTDAAGDPRWTKTVTTKGQPTGHTAYAVSAAKDGSAWVGGAVRTAKGDLDMRLMRFTPTGAEGFSKTLGKEKVDERVVAMDVDPLGTTTLAGDAHDGTTRVARVLRLAPSGDVVWSTDLGPKGGDTKLVSMVPHKDGGVWVLSDRLVGGVQEAGVARLDTKGVLQMDTRVGSGSEGLVPTGLAVRADGIIVSGWQGKAASPKAVLVGAGLDGSEAWRDLGDGGSTWAGLVSTSQTRLVAVGRIVPLGGVAGVRIRGLDAMGNNQWTQSTNTQAPQTARSVSATAQDVVVTGEQQVGSRLFGLLARSDAWGHLSCSAAGTCLGKAHGACDDGKPCTVDACDGVKGCSAAEIEALRCDAGDGCSNVSACSKGTCPQTEDGRLFHRKIEGSTQQGRRVLEADDGDLVMLGESGGKITLTRTDPRGNLRWSKVYSSVSMHWLGLTRLKSGAFLVSSRRSDGKYDFTAYDKLGNSLWGGGGTGTQDVVRIFGTAAMPDGGFVTCHYDNPGNAQSWRKIRLYYWDAKGKYKGKKEQNLFYYNGTWKRTLHYGGNGNYGGADWGWLATACDADPSGRVHVVGTLYGYKWTGCDGTNRAILHGVFPPSGSPALRVYMGSKAWWFTSFNFWIPSQSQKEYHYFSYARSVTALPNGDAVIGGLVGYGPKYPKCTYNQPMTSVDRLMLHTSASGSLKWSSTASDGGEFSVESGAPYQDGVFLVGQVKSSGGTFPRVELWKPGGKLAKVKNLSISDRIWGVTGLANSDFAVTGSTGGGWLLQRFDRWWNVGCKQAGKCAGEGPGNCDDKNPCTADSCTPSSGCKHTAISGCAP